MFESLFGTAATTGSATSTSIGLAPLVLSIVFALALGIALALIYSYKSRYSRSFLITLATLPAIVCVVIAMVNGNIGAGVAVAGAFSLVRFRSVPGPARDIAFIFLAMCIGLVCGMGYVGYAVIITAVLGGANFALQAFGFGSRHSMKDRTLRITVPEDLDYADLFIDVFANFTTYHELVSVKTTNMGSLYKITYNVGIIDTQNEKPFIDALRTRNGNLEIALTNQEVNHEEL